ncbi:hypothetical protein GJAV_G00271000 [Gymnothorax javanicus]|nr:hypothetical protein GJAV_G00271000 [Gymnothorax javanicus]
MVIGGDFPPPAIPCLKFDPTPLHLCSVKGLDTIYDFIWTGLCKYMQIARTVVVDFDHTQMTHARERTEATAERGRLRSVPGRR